MLENRIALFLRFLCLLTLASLFLIGCTQTPNFDSSSGTNARLSCSACDSYLKYPPSLPDQKLLATESPFSALQLREYYTCVLRAHGVQMLRLGQTWTIVLPSDSVFDNDTADIYDSYLPTLNTVADFLRTYNKIRVSVTSYTDFVANDVLTKFGTVSDALTDAQSTEVVRYLTKRHINARLLYAVGGGSHDFIAWNGNEAGRRLNRRVEIHFQYYRDEKAWF